MTRCEKKKLQAEFLRKAGPNAATFKAMMDVLPEIAFYMKDAEGRIMALNRRNCDNCNIHDELDAVGLRSNDIFPGPLAQSYIAHDALVRKTGQPMVNIRDTHTSDRTNDCHVKNVFPLFDQTGTLIGTTCLYYKRPSVDGAPDWHAILKPVTEHIAKHYAEDITLEFLAAMVGTSVSSFRRQFTRTLGISPGRYWRRPTSSSRRSLSRRASGTRATSRSFSSASAAPRPANTAAATGIRAAQLVPSA